MTCYTPINAFRSPRLTDAGKLSISFTPKTGYADLPIKLPCGQCIGCRLERSRQWATRCMHEAQLHEENMFLTLTYDDEHLPRSISKREMQLFLKRLRKSLPSKKISYVYCGEYGDKTQRPHYHALIFGHRFDDCKIHSKTKNGQYLYTSEKLQNLWQKGHCLIGSVTFESAAYVARYCLKKITGKNADKAYERLDPQTGEIYQITPEFFQPSLKPAIGLRWLKNIKPMFTRTTR